MSEAPDNHELARQVAVLEERMNTTQAELKASLEANNASFERLRADMAARDAALADRIAKATEGSATARWWQTTIIIGAVAVALGLAGLMFG